MTKRQREDLWKCLFYKSNIALFVVCGLHLGAKMSEKQSGIAIWSKTRFYGDFRFVLRGILGAKIGAKGESAILSNKKQQREARAAKSNRES